MIRDVVRRPCLLTLGAALAAAAVLALPAGAALVSVYTTQNGALGRILISASGRTLYHYAGDTKTAVRCTGACAAQWPPLLIASGAKPAAGPGVAASLLGTRARPDGKLQVTYRGLTLYLYAGDRKAGDVNGQGSAGLWHALTPAGALVTKAAASSGGSSGGAGSRTSGSAGTSGSGGGAGGGSAGGGGGTAGGGGTNDPTDCANNPGGYGCM